MYHTLTSSSLAVTISERGGELRSICSLRRARELLWQGDDEIWNEHAPNLFPICGRLAGGRYRHKGVEYRLPIHGFLSQMMMETIYADETHLLLCAEDTEQTLSMFPFPFRLLIDYRLEEDTLFVRFEVHNTGAAVLPFSIGAHPGFALPLADGEDLSDCCLEFRDACKPKKLILTEGGLYNRRTEDFQLSSDRVLELNHEMFDEEESLFLTEIPDEVSFCSKRSGHGVTIRYHGFPYLGLWQRGGCRAPYLCIEPWIGSPDPEWEVEDIMQKPDVIHLPCGDRFCAEISYTFL